MSLFFIIINLVRAIRLTASLFVQLLFTEDAEDVPRFLMPGDEPPEPPTHFKPLEDELKMEGHTDNVAAVAWESPTTVWSGSYDHTLKSWDSTTGQLTQSYEVPKAVMALACVAGGGRVSWCGGGDKAVHMWDPRVGATTGATTSLISHTVRELSLTFRAHFFGFFWFIFGYFWFSEARASVMKQHPFLESATTWGTKQSL